MSDNGGMIKVSINLEWRLFKGVYGNETGSSQEGHNRKLTQKKSYGKKNKNLTIIELKFVRKCIRHLHVRLDRTAPKLSPSSSSLLPAAALASRTESSQAAEGQRRRKSQLEI
jgi:hypothetical protein